MLDPQDKQFFDTVHAKVYKASKTDREKQTKTLVDGLKPSSEAITSLLDRIQTIKGDQGEKGNQGEQGMQGEQGIQGEKGSDSVVPGPQGIKGDQGVPGANGKDGNNGKDGIDGKDGKDGKNGSSDTPEDVLKKIKGKIEITQIKGVGEFGNSILNEAKALVPRSLAGLYDLNIGGVTDGQVLSYNSATKKWIPGTGGGVSLSLTTTGTSGVATYNPGTGVLNIPNYSSGSGGITRSVSVISTPTTAGATASTDYVYIVSGTTTLTLPTAVGNTNEYTVKRVGTNDVTVATTSGQTIDGSSTAVIKVQYQSLTFISDNSNWNIK